MSAILMEAIDGASLRDVLAEHGRLAPEAALLVLKGSLLGLAAAHERGVVHRDYKPANVIVRSDGLSKLIDFGIATLTGVSDRAGTPAYMAPEQWTGEPGSPATDVYAATCVFFECITGQKPFGADDITELKEMHLSAPVPDDGAPPAIHALLVHGLAKDPVSRPESAADFLEELEVAAIAEYGEDWETHGVASLAAAAAVLTALLPLAGLLAPGATAGSGVTQLASGGARVGRGLIAKMTTGKTAVAVAAGATAAATVGAGTFLVIGLNTHSKPRPVVASSSSGPTLSVRLAVYTASVPAERLSVRDAPYPQVAGLPNAQITRQVNAALRAPLERHFQYFRQAIDRNSPCTSGESSLKVTTTLGLQGPALISVRYHISDTTPCFESGILDQPVTVNLRTGATLRPADAFRIDLQQSTSGLRQLSQLITSHWTRSCPGGTAEDLPMTAHALTETDTVAGAIGLTFMPDGLDVTWGLTSAGGCASGPVKVPYSEVRSLLSTSVASVLPS